MLKASVCFIIAQNVGILRSVSISPVMRSFSSMNSAHPGTPSLVKKQCIIIVFACTIHVSNLKKEQVRLVADIAHVASDSICLSRSDKTMIFTTHLVW